jgi:hypothetical protein
MRCFGGLRLCIAVQAAHIYWTECALYRSVHCTLRVANITVEKAHPLDHDIDTGQHRALVLTRVQDKHILAGWSVNILDGASIY